MKKKIIGGSVLVVVILIAWHLFMTCGSYSYTPAVLPVSFEEFYADKLKKSKELKARPKNEERLVKFADKTPAAILYIHGYGASRAEGEYVVDRISNKFKLNTYYLRLPGHGTNIDDHADTTGKEHLDEVITTLRMMRKLGDKVIVIGTSMGGVLATYAAAEYPELVDALIISSPAYQFASTPAKMAAFYPMFKLVTTLMERTPKSPIPAEEDNWSLYWYPDEYMRALRQLYQLQAIISNDGVYSRVTQPVLLQYYYKDEENQDPAASVPDMKRAYKSFNNGKPHPLSREIAHDKGKHVLFSKYTLIPPDFDRVTKVTADFIESLGWSK